jgi:hypothetical protein
VLAEGQPVIMNISSAGRGTTSGPCPSSHTYQLGAAAPPTVTVSTTGAQAAKMATAAARSLPASQQAWSAFPRSSPAVSSRRDGRPRAFAEALHKS